MSQTPLKSSKFSEKDLQALSALKLPQTPANNPQKLKEFLQTKQKHNPYENPLFKQSQSQKFLGLPSQTQSVFNTQVQEEKAERPQTQQSQVFAQGQGLRSVRALSRGSQMGKSQSMINLNPQNQDGRKSAAQNLRLSTSSLKQGHTHAIAPQKYVNTTFEKYFNNVGVCTCCADSIKGQQDKVLSYKYPTCVNTLYKKDFKSSKGLEGHGKQPQFIIDNEKRNVKIALSPPFNVTSTQKADYKPFQIKQMDNNPDQPTPNPPAYFVNSTTYGKNFANWGAKPFERVREITKKPFDSPFKAKTIYNTDFNKNENQRLPPDFERDFDEKFYQDMKLRNIRGEFATLLHAPFLAKSTSHEAFQKLYQVPKAKAIPPFQELVSSSAMPHVTKTEFADQFIQKNKFNCPRHHDQQQHQEL